MNTPVTIVPRPLGGPGIGRQPERSGTNSRPATSFDQVLKRTVEHSALRFSRHATERMDQRGIRLDAAQTRRLEDAVARVGGKGGRDALVLLDNLALVVSVRNGTIVTVADSRNLKENVFTNIDSAVIA
ncbi:flagellar operon protein [Geothermobacter ehrlichii]|uniref:Flagellar operon protein n=1 Tax=Geothermobacter ehrlichii TaxID=213224 RepID=A0A5D3WNU5_9BACT|nr:TIGR02530 family flagellar biosynthesis protein [Geothermobacter ehrlichii]TYP00205.1 flagellar operon protein [Geothermobacter ehrlichii]